MLRRPVLIAGIAAAVLGVAVPAAWAYVSITSSTVNPTGTGASIVAPGTVSVTSIGGVATLRWSAPSTPSGATFTYTVSRSGGTGSIGGTCASSVSGITCQDNAATAGQTYTWTVTPHISSWDGANTMAVTAKAAGALSKFLVSLPATATAGTPVDATVTAQDSLGDTVSGYTGTVHFASSDSKAVLPADTAFTAADQGQHVFAGGVTFKTAGLRTITVNDSVTTGAVGTSSGTTVSPATATQLAFTAQPAGAAIGTAFTTQPAVSVEDQFGNVTASTASIRLAITTNTGTSGAALVCDQTQNTMVATSGTATFSGCKIDKAGTSYQLSASSNNLTAATSNSFDVSYVLAFTSPTNNATQVSTKATISGSGANPNGGSVTLTFSPALANPSGTTSVTVTPAVDGTWSYNQGVTNYLTNRTSYTVTATQTGANSATVHFST